ncbi:MAG TPA: DUF4097 family beta strand repeat-containing protein [Thermoanaerobaculia bacterium]|nr:DUF4097 family beta strand repeat-containing protein [Thermoanaerobaculia bacterium]
MIGRRLWIATLLLAAALPASAARVSTEKLRNAVSLDPAGSLLIDNPIGPVVVIGTNRGGLRWEAVKTVRGVDDDAVDEGRASTALAVAGNEQTRALRTIVPYPLRNGRWESQVAYTVEVPRSVSLTVVSISGIVRVSNIAGNLIVKSVNGRIEIEKTEGTVNIETVNGDIIYKQAPAAETRLSSLNGTIEVHTPRGAAFNWTATTIRGAVYSTASVPGFFNNTQSAKIFSAAIGGGDGSPQLHTDAMMGEIYYVPEGSQMAGARPIFSRDTATAMPAAVARPQPIRPEIRAMFQQVLATLLVQPPSSRSFYAQQNRIAGDFDMDAPIGSIFVGQIDGNARIETKAGEIVLGRVAGRGNVQSMGGSLHLGEVTGPLTARTSVGDITARSLLKGGTATTDGGNINIVFSGGDLKLRSGGGDVLVRQVHGAVDIDTRSGDVFVNIDPALTNARITAKSGSGNVVLNLPPGFAADVDATVIADRQLAASITSEIPGLTIIRETIGDRIRIRARGKLNGGGPRVVLNADSGSIQIQSRPIPRITPVAARR